MSISGLLVFAYVYACDNCVSVEYLSNYMFICCITICIGNERLSGYGYIQGQIEKEEGSPDQSIEYFT